MPDTWIKLSIPIVGSDEIGLALIISSKFLVSKHSKIIFNLSGVALKLCIFPFWTRSKNIGVVIGRLKKVQNRDGKVCITNVNKRVDKVFTLSGLYKIITVYNNVDEALESI